MSATEKSGRTTPAVESLRDEQRAQRRDEQAKRKDGDLQEALEGTFPASDPVAAQSATKPGGAKRR